MPSHFRMIMLLLVMLLLRSALCADQAGLSGGDPPKARAILTSLTVDTLQAQMTAEEALVQAGRGSIPALQLALSEEQQQLAAAQAKETDNDQFIIQRRINALDIALARLTWQINPREVLQAWLGKISLPKGNVPLPPIATAPATIEASTSNFSRQADPVSLTDARLSTVFPNYRFYAVDFPPYRGGAFNPMIMRQNIVPAPLARINVFVVGKDRSVTLCTDSASLAQWFITNLPACSSKDARGNATDVMLHVAEGLFWWNDRPLAFTIAKDAFVETPCAAGVQVVIVAGKATVVPVHKNAGTLGGCLTFDHRGRLASAIFTPDLKLALEPLLMIP